jgi:hypothetical protein
MTDRARAIAEICRQFTTGLLIAAAFVVPSANARAQELYGSVVGVVKDAQGGVLPGASVVIVNRNTGLKREATTNHEGGYSFANLPGGTYDVRVTMNGFREAVRSNVPLAVGQISRVDVLLEVGGVAEVVEVTSELQLLQTDKADTRTELKPTEITNLPLNQYRNYQMLLNLVPGSQPGYNAFSETLLPQGTLNMIMGGQDGTQQTTRNDGTNLVNAFLPAAQVYIPPAETIESVNIVTGSMDAESGGASGAAISVITRTSSPTAVRSPSTSRRLTPDGRSSRCRSASTGRCRRGCCSRAITPGAAAGRRGPTTSCPSSRIATGSGRVSARRALRASGITTFRWRSCTKCRGRATGPPAS